MLRQKHDKRIQDSVKLVEDVEKIWDEFLDGDAAEPPNFSDLARRLRTMEKVFLDSVLAKPFDASTVIKFGVYAMGMRILQCAQLDQINTDALCLALWCPLAARCSQVGALSEKAHFHEATFKTFMRKAKTCMAATTEKDSKIFKLEL